MRSLLVLVSCLSLSATSACIFVKKKPSSSSQAVSGEPKNHGQARKEEVHSRNEDRKEAKGK